MTKIFKEAYHKTLTVDSDNKVDCTIGETVRLSADQALQLNVQPLYNARKVSRHYSDLRQESLDNGPRFE